MKFAKVYQQTLLDEGIPKEWVESGIQYKALKKCINKVVEELKEIGLEKETLQALLRCEDAAAAAKDDSAPAVRRASSPDQPRSRSTPPGVNDRLASLIAASAVHPPTPSRRSFSVSTARSTDTRKSRTSRTSSLSHDASNPSFSSPVISYKFDGDLKNFTPKIVVAIETSSNTPVDAYLSSVTIEQLRKMSLNAQPQEEVETLEKTPSCSEIYVLEEEQDSDAENKSLFSDGASILSTDLASIAMSERPLLSQSSVYDENDSDYQPLYSDDEGECDSVSSSDSALMSDDSDEEPQTRVIEIHLESDSVFFHMLTNELKNLDAFKHAREERLTSDIHALRDAISELVNPRSRRTDMYTWREVFKEYMMAGVFFATRESDHGEHDVETARRKLVHFAARILGFRNTAQLLASLNAYVEKNGSLAAQITAQDLATLDRASTAKIETAFDKFFNPSSPHLKSAGTAAPVPVYAATGSTGLLAKLKPSSTQPSSMIQKFHKKESYQAFRQFWEINTELLRVLQFQSMNRTAMDKILKKFDKQTALDSRVNFPALVAADAFLSRSVARDVCCVMTEQLLPVTPQLDDFLCPVCLAVAYKPIRLRCRHVFCVRCMIQMQRAGDDKCPMCRDAAVLSADDTSLDTDHMQFLKLYFPRETKAKQADMERQIADEQMESLKASGECTIM